MAPKNKITRDEIIKAAFSIVRQKGWATLSARMIAKHLKISTRPIYYYFQNMAEIEEEVIKKTIDLFHEYQSKPYTEQLRLNSGMGYVLFSWEEPHLFAALFDRKNLQWVQKYEDQRFDERVSDLASHYPALKGLSIEELKYFEFLGWIFTHGLASMKDLFEATQPQFDTQDLIAMFAHLHRVISDGYSQNTRSMVGRKLIPNPKKKVTKKA